MLSTALLLLTACGWNDSTKDYLETKIKKLKAEKSLIEEQSEYNKAVDKFQDNLYTSEKEPNSITKAETALDAYEDMKDEKEDLEDAAKKTKKAQEKSDIASDDYHNKWATSGNATSTADPYKILTDNK